MISAPVNKIIDMSLVDGPGNRTSIFFQGCNFHCVYCHNPETIRACINCGKCVNTCPSGSLIMVEAKVVWDEGKCIDCGLCYKNCPYNSTPRIRNLTTDQVVERIKKNMPFIKGITTSGGECSLHRDFLLEIFQKVKKLGLETLMDSNGGIMISEDSELMAFTDGVMLDVKMADEDRHLELMKNSNSNVLKNLENLSKQNKLVEIRTVVFYDDGKIRETIEKVSELSKVLNFKNTTYRLIKFRPIGVKGEAEKWSSPDDDYMNELANILDKEYFKKIVIT